MRKSRQYSPEVRERAVRLVREHRKDHPSEWAAICSIAVEDLHLEERRDAPHGSLDWRAETDKQGYDWLDVPIDAETRAALDSAIAKRRRLGRVGPGPLFPSPDDPDKPISTGLANKWFPRCEKLVEGLRPMPSNRTWHGYRAKFATETKHLPAKDRARLGGWKSEETIRRVYDKADRRGMLRVLTERGTLHEVGS